MTTLLPDQRIAATLPAHRAPGDDLIDAFPVIPVRAHRVPFAGPRSVAMTRKQVAVRARLAGLSADRVYDLVAAANELVSNSVVHGGGNGVLSIWQDSGSLVCEVRDRGTFLGPVGTHETAASGEHGRGLFVTHELCDEVEIRTGVSGTSILVRMRLS